MIEQNNNPRKLLCCLSISIFAGSMSVLLAQTIWGGMDRQSVLAIGGLSVFILHFLAVVFIDEVLPDTNALYKWIYPVKNEIKK